ncbi:MAG: VOC family protein [Bdellovibrionales bacterium]|nr:VOC family protein [Bdellovibrionales bacterium]
MNFGQLHHIEYYVKDLERTKDFWGWFLPFLGYVENQKWNGGISWRHQSGTYIVFVQLSPEASLIKNDRRGSGLNHIAFMGKDADHLEMIRLELRRRQITIHAARADYLWFECPNNFAAEIYLPQLS